MNEFLTSLFDIDFNHDASVGETFGLLSNILLKFILFYC